MKKYSLPGITLWKNNTNHPFLVDEGNVYFGRFHLNYSRGNKVDALASIYTHLPGRIKNLFLEDFLKIGDSKSEELILRMMRFSNKYDRKRGLKKISKSWEVSKETRLKAKDLLKQFCNRKGVKYGIVEERYNLCLNSLEMKTI
ncbi:hypothetical protein HY498_03320 [Candidatus Woesearchaeota archaeon]|nr:hypothetical protein [Candidatus Woesearchaeota archaeon]